MEYKDVKINDFIAIEWEDHFKKYTNLMFVKKILSLHPFNVSGIDINSQGKFRYGFGFFNGVRLDPKIRYMTNEEKALLVRKIKNYKMKNKC